MNIKALKGIIGTGLMVSVDFVTKDGRERTINGRTGVRKYTNGRGRNRKVNPDNIGIWETLRPQDKDRNGTKRYKTIAADRIKVVRAQGLEIRVTK